MYFTGKNKHWLYVRMKKKIFQANGAPKEAQVVIFISDRFQQKLYETKKVTPYL
jgi:hypothetical protein